MRKRTIRKIGNSFYVKLEQTDMRDWELKEGDILGVKNLNKVNGDTD